MISIVQTDDYIAQVVEPDDIYTYEIYNCNNRRILVATDKNGDRFTFCLKKQSLIPLEDDMLGPDYELNLEKIQINKTTKIIMSSSDSCFLIQMDLYELKKETKLLACSNFPSVLLRNPNFNPDKDVGIIAINNREFELYSKSTERLSGFTSGMVFLLELINKQRDINETNLD